MFVVILRETSWSSWKFLDEVQSRRIDENIILEGSRRYREAARSPDRPNLRSWGLQEALERQKQQSCAYNGQRSWRRIVENAVRKRQNSSPVRIMGSAAARSLNFLTPDRRKCGQEAPRRGWIDQNIGLGPPRSRWIDKNSGLGPPRSRWIDKNSGLEPPRSRWIDKNIVLEAPGREEGRPTARTTGGREPPKT